MSEKRFLSGLSQNALDDLAILASNIAEARKIRGFSQREMANRCLMALNTFQAIERGSTSVSIGAILAVLDVLEMTDTLHTVAAPQLDAAGQAIRAKKRRSRP